MKLKRWVKVYLILLVVAVSLVLIFKGLIKEHLREYLEENRERIEGPYPTIATPKADSE